MIARLRRAVHLQLLPLALGFVLLGAIVGARSLLIESQRDSNDAVQGRLRAGQPAGDDAFARPGRRDRPARVPADRGGAVSRSLPVGRIGAARRAGGDRRGGRRQPDAPHAIRGAARRAGRPDGRDRGDDRALQGGQRLRGVGACANEPRQDDDGPHPRRDRRDASRRKRRSAAAAGGGGGHRRLAALGVLRHAVRRGRGRRLRPLRCAQAHARRGDGACRAAGGQQRAAQRNGDATGGRAAGAPDAEDGSGRPADRRHRARLQQHAGGDHERHEPDPAQAQARRDRHRQVRRCGDRRDEPGGQPDRAAARLLAPAAAGAAGDRRQPGRDRHVGYAAADARRDDIRRDRAGRRPVEDLCRSEPDRERHPQPRGERARRHARRRQPDDRDGEQPSRRQLCGKPCGGRRRGNM